MNTKNLLIVVLFMLIPTLSLAWGTEINGIYYSFNTSDKTACVVSGHGVFADGVKLQYYSGDIVIPEEVTYEGITYKVTSIGGGRESRGMPYNDGAFEYSSITSIQIPKTIERIGEYTFQGCSSLATVSFDGNIKNIGIGAFKDCCSLVSFEIPEGVETLNYRTFEGCSSLESLTIPTTLKKIGGYMNGGFDNLKALKIKDLAAWSNVSISNSMENPLYYAHHLYLSGVEITELEIPSGTSTIGNYVFCGCEGITSVVFHKDVESIGKSSFWSCDNLETITIKGGDTKIKFEAFRYCSKLTDIYCDTEKCPEIVCDAIEYNGRFVFDENVYEDATLHVKDYAVESFKADLVWSLFKIIDVEKVTDFKLTYYVDDEIYKMEQHKYEDEIIPEPNPIKKGMTFSGWSEIPEKMPAKDITVTGSFSWSKQTKDNVIYEVADTLNNYCKVIGNNNASGEIKIDSVEIDGCYYQPTEVADKAFYGCKDITTIEIPATVATIGERAFANIDKLTDVTCWAEEVPTTDRTAFENSYQDYATLHVVYAAVSKYKEVGPWKDFKDIVAIEGTQRTFVLTYKVDGEVYKVVEIKEGEPITPEAAPTKEGYTFSGWSEIPEIMPSNDLTITGTFTINKYKLVYMVDNEEYKSYEIEYNAAITPETAPTKEGYTFSGWSEIPERMPAKDVTVTGTFAINKYKLVYQVDGADYKTYEIEYNADITPEPAPTKTGYTFSGWSEIPAKMPAKDVTVTGTFAINKYKLIYQVDGAEYKSIELEYNATITPEPAPTKEGYTFSGWSEIPKKMPDHDVTVTGTFTINKYQLVYKVDGEVYKTYEMEYGAAITPEADPTKEGYTFSGWSEIPATMPAHDVTITGTFTKGAYKLTYMIDGEVYKTFTYDFGAAITPEPDPTREGYTFSGWSYIPSTMPAEDVTVTGSFVANKYQLTYMVDGEVYKTYEVAYGTEIEPEPAPTKEGWTFSGWSWIPKKMPAEDVTITGTFTQNQYEAEGGTYVIDEDGATIVKGEDKEGEVVIETTITINGNTYHVTVIGEAAFKGCTKMSALVIPDGIKAIGTSAFEGCSNLKNINIGKGITAIDHKAFANIGTASVASTRSAEEDGLKVSCTAETVPIADSDVFENTDVTNATLVVNDDLVNNYKTTSPWSQFGNIVGFNEASGIDAILTGQQGAVIYSIDGRRLDNAQKGLNIVRTNDGWTRKVVVR